MSKRVLDVKRLRELPVKERLQAIEELWDSIIAEDPDSAVPATPELLADLDRRLTEYEANPSSAVPWRVVREELRATLERPRRG